MALIVKTGGVSMFMHGVKISPYPALEPSAPVKGGRLPKQGGHEAHDAHPVQLSETDSTSSVSNPPKQLRSNERLQEFQEKKLAAKWLRVVKKTLQMAAHCKGWGVKRDYLTHGVHVRQKSLDLIRQTSDVLLYAETRTCHTVTRVLQSSMAIVGDLSTSPPPPFSTIILSLSVAVDADHFSHNCPAPYA